MREDVIEPGVCPHCRGERRHHALLCGERDGKPYSSWELTDCLTCDGKGVVYQARAQAIRDGEVMRRTRIERGQLLRAAATELGMGPAEYSRMEQGRHVPNEPTNAEACG